jgi:hypothetical protein
MSVTCWCNNTQEHFLSLKSKTPLDFNYFNTYFYVLIIHLLGIIANFFVFCHAMCEAEASSIAYISDYVLVFLPDDGRI